MPCNSVHTVSVGKGFGSKGKQHHKHTASETQNHNKCLAVWLCLKMGFENMVLVRLLQIGANDLTVCGGIMYSAV